MRLTLVSVSCALALLAAAVPTAHAKTGKLTQLKGPAGCIARSELIPGCARARFGGGQIADVAVSPDNRNVYVAGLGGGLTVFAIRHGALRQLRGRAGCVSGTGSQGCARMPELFRATKIVVSPDGRTVYVGSADRTHQFGGVVAFARDRASGALRRLSHRAACMGERGPTCAPVRDIFATVRDLAITPDGRSLYVGSNDGAPGGPTRGAVAIFGGNPATGRLSQSDGLPGCLNHRGGDGCRAARGLVPDRCSIAAADRGVSVASDDGRSVAISAFERDPNSAVLVQIIGGGACIGADPSEGCAPWNLGSVASANRSSELVFGAHAFHLYFGHALVDPSSGGGACGEQIAVVGSSPTGEVSVRRSRTWPGVPAASRPALTARASTVPRRSAARSASSVRARSPGGSSCPGAWLSSP